MNRLSAEPLFFNTIFKERIWGGSKLASALNKELPPEKLIGEAWEICGFGDDQSVAVSGKYEGKTLSELFNTFRHGIANNYQGASFPLLLKFLDAKENLSVQIHPDCEYAKTYGLGECGKSECWYILDAKKDAQLAIGFKNKVTSADIRSSILSNSLGELLNFVKVMPGEVYYIPAGTVHAIMGGVLIYEIQEPSDVTFRLFDWGRKDFSGHARELHIEQSLQLVDTVPHNHQIKPISIHYPTFKHNFLIACRFFSLEEYVFTHSTELRLPPKTYIRVLTVLNGTINIHFPAGKVNACKGQSVLIPWVMQDVLLTGESEARFFCVSVPDLQKDIIAPLVQADISPSAIKDLGGFDQKNDLLSLISAHLVT